MELVVGKEYISNWSKKGRITPHEVKQKLFEDMEGND
jgi:hypothetical protein